MHLVQSIAHSFCCTICNVAMAHIHRVASATIVVLRATLQRCIAQCATAVAHCAIYSLEQLEVQLMPQSGVTTKHAASAHSL